MNIFNDATSTGGITLRTQNFQDASVVSNSVPVLGIGQAVGVQPISSYGLSLLNTDASALRTSLLTGTEEAVVYEANNTNEILFYTNLAGVAPTADKLRLKIADADIHAEVPILVGGSLKLENGTAGVLSTTSGNKDMEIASHGTGAVVLRQDTTEIINATPATISTPMIDIKALGSGSNALNGILGKAGKHLYIVGPQSKDLRLCVNGSSGDEDGELAMNIGTTKISVYKTIGVSGSGIDLGSSAVRFNNIYGNNLYFTEKAIGKNLRSEDLSPFDPIYQEIQFGLQPPVGGGSGLNEINFLFDKTDESTPPAGSTQAGTSVFRLTPSTATLNVPLTDLEIADTLRVSKIKSRDPTTNTHLLMNTNNIQLYTGSVGAPLGTEHIRIEDNTGNNNINLLTQVKLYNNVSLDNNINLADATTAFGSAYINQLFSNSVAPFTANSDLGLTANGTGTIKCNSNTTFANDKTLTLQSNEGNKLFWDTTSRVYTSPGQLHFNTNRETFIWAGSDPVLQIRNSTTTLGSHLSPQSDNDKKLGQVNRKFTELYAQNVYNKSNIFYRVGNLPSTPTTGDYTNVYTLDYFDSRPLLQEGITSTYDLSTIGNMTGGLVWTALDNKSLVVDMKIVGPQTGTMYLRYTTDDGSRIWIDNTELVAKYIDGTTNPNMWQNHSPTGAYADFAIVAGTEYRLRFQYVEALSGAEAKLEWTTSSRNPTGNDLPYSTNFSPIIAGNNLGIKANVGCEVGFGRFSVKTQTSATSTGNNHWDDNYVVIGEPDKNYVSGGITNHGLGVGIGINKDDANPLNHYGVIKCLEPSNAWRPLRLSASSIELDYQGTNKMYVRGNVVLATKLIPSANATLDIGSDTNVGSGVVGGGQVSQWFRNGFFSNVYAGNVLITSDRNMKEDIIDLPIGLDYIRKLRPKQYKYKDNKSGRRHWGLIAQEVREINQDDMISSWGLRPNGTQQLNYNEFIAPLIQAVKQLDTKVEQLSHTAGHKIDTLQQQPTHYANDTTFIDEARLDILEERVAEVEKYGNRLASLEAHEDSIVDSEGSPDNMELAMNSIHALEQRVLKAERANKRLTTAVNKLLKQTP
jgi:hypothetical protein